MIEECREDKKLLLVDGNSIINRAFYATFVVGNLMKSPEGIPTNGIYGFLNIFLKVINEEKPTNIVVAFDKGGKTKRHEMFEEYKEGRHKMPEELREQFPILKEILNALNIPIVEESGIEADDILGTIAKNTKYNTCILTGDRDYFQLVDEYTYIRYPKNSFGKTTDIIYDSNKIFEEYSLSPEKLIDVKGLMGDKSDNIPGIAGIGEKTAINLIKEYGTIENIYKCIDENKDNLSPKQKEKILLNREMAILSKKLGKIDINLDFILKDIEKIIEKSEVEVKNMWNNNEIYSIFKKLSFNSLLSRLSINREDKKDEIKSSENIEMSRVECLSYEKSKQELPQLIKSLKNKEIALFIYTREYDKKDLDFDKRKEIYEFLEKENIQTKYMETLNGINTISNVNSYFVNIYDPSNKDKTYIFKLLDIVDILKDKEIKKIMYSAKNDFVYFFENKIGFENIIFDTKVAEYIIESQTNNYDFENLIIKYFPDYIGKSNGIETYNILSKNIENYKKLISVKEYIKEENKEVLKLKKDFDRFSKNNITKEEFLDIVKNCIDKLDLIQKEDEKNKQELLEKGTDLAYFNYLIYKVQNENIKSKNQEELLKLEVDLIEVLASMQYEGVSIDSNELLNYGKDLKLRQKELEEKIYSLVGEFNISSPKQLGEILFEKLGLKPKGKTKGKKGFSTSVDVLESLIDDHEIISYVLEYRKISKIYSTYIEGLLSYINPTTNKVHSIFHQNVTTTGRISSTDPNLQNIPTRTDLGKEIRKSFIASRNNILVDADYSQIELRVMADVSDEKTLIEAFLNNEDIHKKTASTMFHLPISEVSSELRQKAKAINFGIIYGISNFGLSQNTQIPVYEAKSYIEKYFEKFPNIKKYMEDIKKFVSENGYVLTKLNRRRYFNEIHSSNFIVREAAKRAAMNAPIQGTAADITKIAMIKVYNRLKKEGLESKLILQIHDELIIDAKKDEKDIVKNLIKEEMENAYKLKVPLVVDVSAEINWYNCK